VPPGTIKGVLKTGAQMLTGNPAEVLMDKLGERLAFERAGARLYEALMLKCLALGEAQGRVVDPKKIEEIYADELRHFELVREAIENLGGDPTAQTPCADLVGMQSLGLVQAINESRTTLAQSLNTVLIAELTDNAGWELLISLANEVGQSDLVEVFQSALAAEQERLLTVKQWLEQLTLREAKVVATT
jgi:hypothetical protein